DQIRWTPTPSTSAHGTDMIPSRASGSPSVEAAAAPAPAQARNARTVPTVRTTDRRPAEGASSASSSSLAGTCQDHADGSALIIENAGFACSAVKTLCRVASAGGRGLLAVLAAPESEGRCRDC